MNCKVLIADQHEIFRAGLRSILQDLNGVSVCGESGDGRDTLEQAKQLAPDILIANMNLPRANGLILARRLMRHGSRVQLMIVIDLISIPTIHDLLEAGVKGIVSTADPAEQIIESVDALKHG